MLYSIANIKSWVWSVTCSSCCDPAGLEKCPSAANIIDEPHSIPASICESDSRNSRETEASSSSLILISFSGIKSGMLLRWRLQLGNISVGSEYSSQYRVPLSAPSSSCTLPLFARPRMDQRNKHGDFEWSSKRLVPETWKWSRRSLASEPAELTEVSSLKWVMESCYNYKKIGIDYL